MNIPEYLLMLSLLGLGYFLGRWFSARSSSRIDELRYVPGWGTSEAALDFLRRRYTWRSGVTGITFEDRGQLRTGNGIWLCRDGESLQLELQPNEFVSGPILVPNDAAIACALVFKQREEPPNGYDFSRLVIVQLPLKTSALDTVRVETVIQEDGSVPRQWVSELESISADGQRVLLKRADEIQIAPGTTQVTYRTFLFDMISREWTQIQP